METNYKTVAETFDTKKDAIRALKIVVSMLPGEDPENIFISDIDETCGGCSYIAGNELKYTDYVFTWRVNK